MQEEWAAGVSHWVARREIERVNLYFRRKMGLLKGHSTDEWKEGYGEWQDRSLMSQALKWLRCPGRDKRISRVKRRVSASMKKSVARSVAMRDLKIAQTQAIPKQQISEDAPKAAREERVSATQLESDRSHEEPPPAAEPEKETESSGKKKFFLGWRFGFACGIVTVLLVTGLSFWLFGGKAFLKNLVAPDSQAYSTRPLPNEPALPKDAKPEEKQQAAYEAPIKKIGGKPFTVPGLSMEMIWVEPGTFTMGSPVTEAGRGTDESQHQVTLTNGFYLGKHEVSQAQWLALMETSPSQFSGNNRPVEKVSWGDVQIFLTRLNAAEQAAGRLPSGWSYVLPTESEWEYACRAGTTTIFSWGDTATSTQANFKGTNPYGGAAAGPFLERTTDVGSYGANPWGFFDMHGNVSEWTSDWAGEDPGGPVTDPIGPASGSYRVLRGGSWNYPGTYLRSARRNSSTPGNRYLYLGFRVGFKFTGVHTVTSASNLQMIWVEPGTFTMGPSERWRDQYSHQHNVTLTKGFYLGKYEVTQAQYQAVMTGVTGDLNATPSYAHGNPNHPVEMVSWDDVQVFLYRLNAVEKAAGRLPAGWSYVLPTGSEWEYACRAGTETHYSWGNDINSTLALYSFTGSGAALGAGEVGQYAPNPWGFYDMHGNIMEWCSDWYGEYPSGSVTNPTGPSSGSVRVSRGGFWGTSGDRLRSASRIPITPGSRNAGTGFRAGLRFIGE